MYVVIKMVFQFHIRYNSLLFCNFKFVRVCSLVGRYFYSVFIVNKFEIVFSLNVKDNNIFPCLHIRLSDNI